MNLESGILQIPIEDIIPNRFQPRLNFDENSLNELAESIKEHGIIQPLVLRKLGDKYEIIAGERRYKAAQMAGLTTVPAVINNVDDNEAAERAIVENVQRSDLTAIEEARSYKNLLDRGYLTQEQLAKKMGLSQAAVANKLRLLNLDEEVQQALLDGEISERHGRTLLTIKDKEEQKEWLHRIINERLTVRQLDLELKKAQEEKNLIGLDDDDNGEVPLVESSASVDDIRANAVDINDHGPKMSSEDIMKPQEVINEEIEKLDVDIPTPVMNNEPIIEGYDNFKTFNGKEEDDEDESGAVPERFNDEDNSFVTATRVPESNIVTPESTSTFMPQDDFNQNNNNKFFSFNGPSEPEPEKELVSASNENPFNNDFEVYNEPTIPGAPTNSASETNPFNDPEPHRPEPLEEPKNDLNTAFDVNPNNKFFKPVYDEKTMADVKMENENERIVDPMANIDRLSPEFQAKQHEAHVTSLKDAISEIRKTVEKLGDSGMFINVEEIDFDTNYQITIQIKKDE